MIGNLSFKVPSSHQSVHGAALVGPGGGGRTYMYVRTRGCLLSRIPRVPAPRQSGGSGGSWETSLCVHPDVMWKHRGGVTAAEG